MIAKAKSTFMRMSPTKIRPVIDLIRGKDVSSSLAILMHMNRPTTSSIVKLLSSAISNAKSKGLTEDQLVISKIFADQGPTMKRWRAAAFGRATGIQKKTTHLTIELDVKTK